MSIDGRSVQTLIAAFRKYAIAANQRSTDRVAASRLVSRNQQIMPHVSDLGDTATVVIRLAATGGENTSYVVPWTKIGIPVTSQGPVPSPRGGNGRLMLQPGNKLSLRRRRAQRRGNLFQFADLGTSDNTLPSYMEPIRALLNASVSRTILGI